MTPIQSTAESPNLLYSDIMERELNAIVKKETGHLIQRTVKICIVHVKTKKNLLVGALGSRYGCKKAEADIVLPILLLDEY